MEQNGATESKVRKILFNEVSLVIAIGGFILSCFFGVIKPFYAQSQQLQMHDYKIASLSEKDAEMTQTINELKVEIGKLNNTMIEFVSAVKELQHLTLQKK